MPAKYHHIACFRLSTNMYVLFMCQSFVRGVPTLTTFFFFFLMRVKLMEGEGRSKYRHISILWHLRPASKLPLKCRFAGGPMLAQHRMLAWFFRGSGPVLLRNPIFFVFFFRVGGPDPLPPPPLNPHMAYN